MMKCHGCQKLISGLENVGIFISPDCIVDEEDEERIVLRIDFCEECSKKIINFKCE